MLAKVEINVIPSQCRHCQLHLVAIQPDPSFSSLPDRYAAELRHLHAELGARPWFLEAARLLETFLPGSPTNHARDSQPPPPRRERDQIG